MAIIEIDAKEGIESQISHSDNGLVEVMVHFQHQSHMQQWFHSARLYSLMKSMRFMSFKVVSRTIVWHGR